MDELIRIDYVIKRFDGQAGEIVALERANLAIDQGEFVCLIGASGDGKSTLLRIVAGFEAASDGHRDRRPLHRSGRTAQVSRRLPPSAFGRHEAARGDRPGARQ